jgi:hypothetical protein
MTYEYGAPQPPKRKLKTWHVIILVLLGAITLCTVGAAIAGQSQPQEPLAATAKTGVPNTDPPKSTAVAPPPAPNTFTVKGTGNAVKPVGAILTGTYRVDYSFSAWCGIAEFVKGDGESGANFMEDINGCSGNPNQKLVGSTIVHLNEVKMVKVGNTRGAWTLVFVQIS